MQLTLEQEDVANHASTMYSLRKVNENSVTGGYFNLKKKYFYFNMQIIKIP